jgi:hypothetical protein
MYSIILQSLDKARIAHAIPSLTGAHAKATLHANSPSGAASQPTFNRLFSHRSPFNRSMCVNAAVQSNNLFLGSGWKEEILATPE